ncbi:MAG: amino acid permease, partial [Chloroflexi bacterium]|nr:amino acid permease [Chloroflexota bacterium]
MGAIESSVSAVPVAERKLRRDVGLVGLMFASVGSIIGSGWLFGALGAARIAGPAALISWVLGGAAVILLALIHAELGGMYPVAGGSARFPHYAYGSMIGFAAGWFAFLGAVTTAPIEVEAALQYASSYIPGLVELQGSVQVLTWG